MQNITIDDLAGEQRDLAETIGIEAYLKLVKDRGGTTIYIAKPDKAENIKRDMKIIAEYTGYNQRDLARQYNLSDRTIRRIIEEYVHNPLPGQLSFFDE